MTQTTRVTRFTGAPRVIRAALFFAACTLAACGSSGGSGAITVNTATRGVISSSSALVVNGITFDVSQANIIVDGTEHQSSSELRKGRIAEVRGHVSGSQGEAAEVHIDDALEGKVDGKDVSGIDVHGQRVKVDDATEFEDGARRMDSIAEGERVEVHGFPDADGTIRATRIEKRDGQGEDFEIKGFVSDLVSGPPATFNLRMTPTGPVAFSVQLAPGVSLPAGLANGSQVEVRTDQPLGAGNLLIASAVKLEDEKLGGDDNQNGTLEVEVEGLVTSGDASAFMVGGQSVVTDTSTRFEGGAPADVVPGAAVEVEGSLDSSNVLHADKVSFRASARLQDVPAQLTITDARSGTFTLLGILVHVNAETDFKDFHGAPVDLNHLGAGPVAVRGSVVHGTDVLATELELTDDPRLVLQGPVSAKDATAGTLLILGVTVDLRSAEFSGTGPSSLSDFLAQVQAGSLVKATGKDASALAGGILTAKEVELESGP